VTRLGKYLWLSLSLIVSAGPTFALSPIRALMQENRFEDALTACRQFETLSTYETDNMLACTWVYYRTGRNTSAERILEKLKRKFSLPEYQLLLAYGRIARKQYGEAKRLIDAVVNENKGTSVGLTAQELQGENYEAQGQLSVAAFIYKQVVSDDPKRGWSHWGLGRYHLASGETQRAVMELETTAKLWPKHVGSRFDLAIVALSQNNTAEAFRWLNECYKLNKADPGVLEQLGVLFEKKGLIADAVKYWTRALELNKDATLSKEKLAKYGGTLIDNLIANKRYAEALAKLKASGDVASQPELLLKRGVIYRNMKNYEKASIDLKTYLAKNPSDALAMRELGICYLNLNLPDEARNYFKRAASAEPDNGFNHAWLAWVSEAQKDYTAAREEWRKAIDLFKDPNEIEKASRRLSSVETRLRKGEGSKRRKDKGMDMGLGGAPEESED
jgi:tetratricopeptide (TPR) repeat protein